MGIDYSQWIFASRGGAGFTYRFMPNFRYFLQESCPLGEVRGDFDRSHRRNYCNLKHLRPKLDA